MPAAVPADVNSRSPPTYSTFGSSSTSGKRSRNIVRDRSSAWSPCDRRAVRSRRARRRPSRTWRSCAPRRWAARSARIDRIDRRTRLADRLAGGSGSRSCRPTGAPRARGRRAMRAPRSVVNVVRSGVHSRSSDRGTPAAVRSMPQTSQAMAVSNNAGRSNSSTATRWTDRPATASGRHRRHSDSGWIPMTNRFRPEPLLHAPLRQIRRHSVACDGCHGCSSDRSSPLTTRPGTTRRCSSSATSSSSPTSTGSATTSSGAASTTRRAGRRSPRRRCSSPAPVSCRARSASAPAW